LLPAQAYVKFSRKDRLVDHDFALRRPHPFVVFSAVARKQGDKQA